MYIVRKIRESDLEAFHQLSLDSGYGISSLPKDYEKLKEIIYASAEAFASPPHKAAVQTMAVEKSLKYVFVLEDLETSQVGGCCSIVSLTEDANYCYKVHYDPLVKIFPQTPATAQVLVPFKREKPMTELCSLYLQPKLRQKGIGRLLSLSRLLFIGSFKERFKETLFARMRGYITANGTAPFWEGIGQKLFNVPYVTILALVSARPDVAKMLLSQYPIYTALLPPELQQSIGAVHPHTEAATLILKKQGFQFSGMIDPLDSGPWLEASTKEVEIIRTQHFGRLSKICPTPLTEKMGFISNAKLDFRVCYNYWDTDTDGGIILEDKVAHGLQVKVGERVTFSPML